MEHKQNYLKRLEDVISHLANHPSISLDNCSLGDPMDEIYVEAMLEEFQQKLNEDSLAYFFEVDGITMFWSFLTPQVRGKISGGEINIVLYGFLLQAPGFGFNIYPDDPIREFVSNLFAFDQYEKSMQSTLKIGLELTGDRERLWLWNDDGEKYPLSLSIPQYFERVLETKGFIGWQYFFIDLDACNFEDPFFRENFASVPHDNINYLVEFLDVMPQLFPEQDYSFYRERLAFFQEANANFSG